MDFTSNINISQISTTLSSIAGHIKRANQLKERELDLKEQEIEEAERHNELLEKFIKIVAEE